MLSFNIDCLIDEDVVDLGDPRLNTVRCVVGYAVRSVVRSVVRCVGH